MRPYDNIPIMAFTSKGIRLCFLSQIRTYSKQKQAFKGLERKKHVHKSERMLNKLIYRSESQAKRKKWFGLEGNNVGGQVSAVPSQGAQRRAAHLNVYLHENISNVFYQGEVCPQLNDYGFTIEKVKITPDMNNLNIYWNALGDIKRDNEVQESLERNKGLLRSVLTHKRLLGRIPPINFIRDTTNAKLQEVEKLLAVADMGPDHVPTDIAQDLRDRPNLTGSQSLQQNLKDLSRRFENSRNVNYLDGPSGTNEIANSFEKQTDPKVDWGKSSDKFHSNEEESEQEETSDSTVPWFSDIKLRSDVYEVDHASLSQRILSMKNRGNVRNLGQFTDQLDLDDRKANNIKIDKYLERMKQERKDKRLIQKDMKVDMRSMNLMEEQNQQWSNYRDTAYDEINTDADDDIIDDYENHGQ